MTTDLPEQIITIRISERDLRVLVTAILTAAYVASPHRSWPAFPTIEQTACELIQAIDDEGIQK